MIKIPIALFAKVENTYGIAQDPEYLKYLRRTETTSGIIIANSGMKLEISNRRQVGIWNLHNIIVVGSTCKLNKYMEIKQHSF